MELIPTPTCLVTCLSMCTPRRWCTHLITLPAKLLFVTPTDPPEMTFFNETIVTLAALLFTLITTPFLGVSILTLILTVVVTGLKITHILWLLVRLVELWMVWTLILASFDGTLTITWSEGVN